MRSTRGGGKRGPEGRHSPFPEFRAPPGASRATPTGEVVDVETGIVRSFVPPRLLPRISWADEVEKEERREPEVREREQQERDRVEKERVEREEMRKAQAALELADRRRAERVRVEMERLKRVRAEKDRRERARAAQRAAEERIRAAEVGEEEARMKAVREERKSLEKERVERARSREKESRSPSRGPPTMEDEPKSDPFTEAPPALQEPTIPEELEQFRSQGALPRRLANRTQVEEDPRPSSRVAGSYGGVVIPETAGPPAEKAPTSRSEERKYTDYLFVVRRNSPPPGESPRSPSPPRGMSEPLARSGPEGREREQANPESAPPPYSALPTLPVPAAPTSREPMEWDLEYGTLTSVRRSAASREVPPSSTGRQKGERKRKRKKRSKPYNPRRHLEVDDYVSEIPTPPRSPSPLPGSSRWPPSSQVEKDVEKRVEKRVGRGVEPRVENRVGTRGGRSQSRGSLGSRERREIPPHIKTRGIMFGGLLPVPIDPALDPPLKACYNCWQEGHSCVRCPRPAGVFCHNCGRRGADLTVCPRCCVAHRAYLKERFGREGPRLSASHRQGNMANPPEEGQRRNSPAPLSVDPMPPAPCSRPRQRADEASAVERTAARARTPIMAVGALSVVPASHATSSSIVPGPSRPRTAPEPVSTPSRRLETREEPTNAPLVHHRRQDEVSPDRRDPIPVGEALRLVSSLQDLPVEVRSAVLLRVFGSTTGFDSVPGPADREGATR